MSDVAIVIPTMGRARLLFPLVWNIAKTTPAGIFQIYFVINRDDEITWQTVRRLEGPIRGVLTDKHGYPRAVNVGVEASEEPLIVIVNDDVKFHDGWWEGLQKVLSPSISVIGTNDLSPHTANGDTCSMPIVKRDYIKLHGGAWGEPGVTMHEGYHHNFSETELFDLAKHRGVAVFAPDCVIEHVHPDWGKAEVDETYRVGSKRPGGWEQDKALFNQRRQEWCQ